jgi:hypothetical protein
MLRNTIIASAVVLAASAFAPTVASAGGGYHGHHRHWHHVRPFHRHVFHVRPLHRHVFYHHHVRCWRWVPTRFGYRRVWVCG